MSPERVFGLLNINKPPGPTSHDVVARIRRGTRIRKVGHAGTLDPMASGVLVLCMGPATRLSEYAMRAPKRYRAEVRFGINTDTYDAEGQVTEERPVAGLTPEAVEAALEPFRGDIAQVPPMYSAIKKDGKKLYELARSGQEIEREPRHVHIEQLSVVTCELPYVTLEVVCSPGTYIRSLAYDLGQALGVGAHLTGLVRVASGGFTVENAVTLDELDEAMQAGTWRQYLLAPDAALYDMAELRLDDQQAARVRNGNPIAAPEGASGEARAYGPDGELLAIMAVQGDEWRCVKVFPPEG